MTRRQQRQAFWQTWRAAVADCRVVRFDNGLTLREYRSRTLAQHAVADALRDGRIAEIVDSPDAGA